MDSRVFRGLMLTACCVCACSFGAYAAQPSGPAFLDGRQIEQQSGSIIAANASIIRHNMEDAMNAAKEAVPADSIPDIQEAAEAYVQAAAAEAPGVVTAAVPAAQALKEAAQEAVQEAAGDAAAKAAETASVKADETFRVYSSESAKAAGETPIGAVVTEESTLYERGECLGNFQIVGYSDDPITYSGNPTRANHTIAVDRSVIPLGTKVFINNTVYTADDIGSGIKGKMIDIYYDTLREAANVTLKGRRYADVYLAVKK